MSLFKEIHNSVREKDELEIALEECGLTEAEQLNASACKQYMDPSRVKDFAKAIAEMMDEGISYADAKAKAFDETEMPPAKSECCSVLRSQVENFRKK